MHTEAAHPSDRRLSTLVLLFGLVLPLTLSAAEQNAEQAAAQTLDRHFKIPLAPFRYVHFTGPGRLHISQGAAGPLIVSGATARDVLVESVDRVLYLDTSRSEDHLVQLQVTVADLHEVYVEGPGTVQLSGLHTRQLMLEGHGPGTIRARGLHVADLVVSGHGRTAFALSGAARHQTVELSGASVYQAADLATQTSRVQVRGDGRVLVWADELLDVNILGAGQVVYQGSPWISQQVYGAGGLRQR